MATNYEPLIKAAFRDVSVVENIFDHIPDVLFYVKDEQARYVVVNMAVVEQSGARSKAEVCGRTADELLPGNGFSTMNQDMGVISKGKCVVDLLRLYISWGGKTQWCLSTKYPIIEEDGRIIGLIGISRRLPRSEEHTSELQSLMRISYAVFCLNTKNNVS